MYGLQFHPEVYHSIEGKKVLHNFLVNICGCKQDWTPAHFITDTVAALKETIGNRKVIMALSGGVDSTVAATLIRPRHRRQPARHFCRQRRAAQR
jgi:GMP synthase (glutamine-hydrolysing)